MKHCDHQQGKPKDGCITCGLDGSRRREETCAKRRCPKWRATFLSRLRRWWLYGEPMSIQRPQRCPKCGTWNVSIGHFVDRRGKQCAVVCHTPGCWYMGPKARSPKGAIRKWNREAVE